MYPCMIHSRKKDNEYVISGDLLWRDKRRQHERHHHQHSTDWAHQLRDDE